VVDAMGHGETHFAYSEIISSLSAEIPRILIHVPPSSLSGCSIVQGSGMRLCQAR
jgi:hypothetical protein